MSRNIPSALANFSRVASLSTSSPIFTLIYTFIVNISLKVSHPYSTFRLFAATHRYRNRILQDNRNLFRASSAHISYNHVSCRASFLLFPVHCYLGINLSSTATGRAGLFQPSVLSCLWIVIILPPAPAVAVAVRTGEARHREMLRPVFPHHRWCGKFNHLSFSTHNYKLFDVIKTPSSHTT